MRHQVFLAILIAVAAVTSLEAQTVRGVVVDDSTKLPIEGVTVALLDGEGHAIAGGTRSDSSGNFTIHAARPGTYMVRAARIGYRPLTSEPVKLGIGQLAVMRLRMTTLAQQLVPVRITERRALTAAELMSATGFDLRESKGLGKFLSGSRLAAMGHDDAKSIIGSQFQPTVYVSPDPVLGDVIRMRQGLRECAPEIYLDGRLISTVPDSVIEWDASNLTTLLDSIRFQARVETEDQRISFSQGYALSVLANLRAVDLHGIEVYNANQVLPASLGGWFGVTKGVLRPCGTLAVWTKGGLGLPLASARNRRVSGVQVITGNVVSYDNGLPVAGVPITLLTDARDVVGPTVRADERGEFTIRTNRAGTLRLHVGSVGYTPSTTAAFPLARDELVAVKVFVSPTQAVMAPLGVVARVMPKSIGATSLAGFTYRRERKIAGAFFRRDDIARLGARRVADLVRPLAGVRIEGIAPADTITFLQADDLPRCRPLYFVDGKLVTGDARAAAEAITMDRVFGVEVYVNAADVPAVYADLAGDCGVIAMWTKTA